jgi:hypothetical protein
MASAAMNMVSALGFSWGKLSFKKMSAGGRLCNLQENPQFWVPTIKARQPGGTLVFMLWRHDDVNVVFCVRSYLAGRLQREGLHGLVVDGQLWMGEGLQVSFFLFFFSPFLGSS